MLCTNTMHKVADAIAAAIDVPFVHIADTTADAVAAAGPDTVGLLATALHDGAGLLRRPPARTARAGGARPRPDERRIVHAVIYDELCVGIVRDESRDAYRRVMDGLAARGAQGILLGCTEIDLLIGPADTSLPLLDTTRLHAEAAVELALQ